MVVMVMLTKMEKVIMKMIMIMIIINEWKHSILIHVCFASFVNRIVSRQQ